MPRNKRSINLSTIVTLLMETFLPALRQKYLFANFEQSNENRMYKDYIPSYLHNRPREVILHSLDRKASSACFTADDITVLDSEKGIFEVTNSNKKVYTIDFTVPSCSCPDWTEHHYPCKHLFAIFRYHCSRWDWKALPLEYLSTPRMSLDSQALQSYFDTDATPQLENQTENCSDELRSDELPKRKVSSYNDYNI